MPEHASVTPPRTALNAKVLAALADDLAQLRRDFIEQEVRYSEMLEGIDLAHRSSARNLIHYVSLRRHDIRGLQSRLAQAGLSSLGRSESHVLVTIDRLCAMLALARGEEPVDPVEVPPVGFRHGDQLLAANAARLLGRGRQHRRVRIMVTLSAVVATDPAMVRELLLAGMDCARINCAHDDEAVWTTLVEQVTRARSESGIDCSILMDLCGPKPRTGSIRGGEELVRLLPGDHFRLVPMQRARRPWPSDRGARETPEIGCDLPEIFRNVRSGESIWFDDGKIGGVIEDAQPEALTVRVTQVRLTGRKLRPERGINLPDSVLDLPAITAKDLHDLDFVCRHADVVALSFAQHEADVLALQDAIQARRREPIGLVLKIETRAGFQNLPRLLLAAMRSPSYGVMIARGDLAVELGFDRLAEVQEEILWVAEAAHAPTIWATQVLESLAKKGVRTRAEVTDAAMAGRAEAVMLNKGPHVVDAIRALDDILGRMQAHQSKKRSLLRPLHISENL